MRATAAAARCPSSGPAAGGTGWARTTTSAVRPGPVGRAYFAACAALSIDSLSWSSETIGKKPRKLSSSTPLQS